MLTAQVPGIVQERMTVSFANRGLYARPQLIPLVPLLLANCIDTVQALKQQLELLITTVATRTSPFSYHNTLKWCAYHQSYGTHSTEECH